MFSIWCQKDAKTIRVLVWKVGNVAYESLIFSDIRYKAKHSILMHKKTHLKLPVGIEGVATWVEAIHLGRKDVHRGYYTFQPRHPTNQKSIYRNTHLAFLKEEQNQDIHTLA